MGSLHVATTVRTVFVSYLIVVFVRNTVTLAVALLPTLAKVQHLEHVLNSLRIGSS